jgi:hypothetical protein
MKQLDDLVERIDKLYIPIYVKGKLYPGNNPYVLNEINNMLEAGAIKKRFGELSTQTETLEISDIQWNDERLHFDKEERYIYYEELNQICLNIDETSERLWNEKSERLGYE